MIKSTLTLRASKWIIPLTTLWALLLDIATKDWARTVLTPGESMPFIPGIIQFYLTTNTGAAFSLGAGNGYLMTSLATVVTLFLVAWMFRRDSELVSNLERFGLGCLFGGACGNLYDRFTQGKVTDFLDFQFIDFPIFNAADICIDVGIALILLVMLREKQLRKTAETTSDRNNKSSPREDDTLNREDSAPTREDGTSPREDWAPTREVGTPPRKEAISNRDDVMSNRDDTLSARDVRADGMQNRSELTNE